MEDKLSLFLVDSHCHLELEPLFDKVGEVVRRAKEAGVGLMITYGIDLPDAERALSVAEKFPEVYAAVGFHPHNAKDIGPGDLDKMTQLASSAKVVAYGEIGLDFFRNHSPRDEQIAAFRDQLELAKGLNKPVAIHLRNAYGEGLDMLEAASPFPASGVIHCFSGDERDAERALDIGFYISVPGTLTYKKNDKLRSIIKDIPHDRLLLETDCPFLAPEPLRGKDNEPAFMVHTATRLAEVLGVTLEEISRITSSNTLRLFNLHRETH